MAQFFPKKTNFSSFFPRHLFLTRNSSWKNSSFPRFLTRNPKYSPELYVKNINVSFKTSKVQLLDVITAQNSK